MAGFDKWLARERLQQLCDQQVKSIHFDSGIAGGYLTIELRDGRTLTRKQSESPELVYWWADLVWTALSLALSGEEVDELVAIYGEG